MHYQILFVACIVNNQDAWLDSALKGHSIVFAAVLL
jgi:hypothetical protein